jgi:protein involved in polysaccharide export with SLBB domain
VEALSTFEQYVSGKAPKEISFDIRQFGYELFRSSPGSSAAAQPGLVAPGQMPSGVSQAGNPIQYLPPENTYPIGPGDEVRVTVWGSVEGAWTVTVDRDGTISLPKIGVLGVTGMTFKDLQNVLRKEFSKYYTDFEMNVSLGALKMIRVYVVGNAISSGVYLVPSLSSVVNGLTTASGPSKAGTLRDIQVKRNGEVVAHLDVYDLLIRGDRSTDIRLQPEDVVFIPPIGPIVGVAGHVDRPAIYELKGRTRLSEAIKMAGGVIADAYLHRVQLERVSQRASRVILDVNVQQVKGKNDIFLEDGDIVKVFPAITVVTNKIVLKGNVRRPGDYEWKQGSRVRDIIPNFEALSPDSLLDYALVERMVPPDMHQEYLTFNLGQAVSGKDESQNILLQPYDTVTIFNKWDMVPKDKVHIAGAVNKPGAFEFRPQMKLSELLKLAGGMKRFAFTRTAELTRTFPTDEGTKTERIYVHPAEALAGDPASDIVLREDDYLFVRTVPDWQIYRMATITGEVKFPGDYALYKGEKLSSLIERAGGFTEQAYVRGAVMTRASVKQQQQKQMNETINQLERELLAMASSEAMSQMDKDEADQVSRAYKERRTFIDSLRMLEAKGRMVVPIDAAAKLKGTPQDLDIEDGDTLDVPSNPKVVYVVGAVNNAASFVYMPKQDYTFYIGLAGGYSRTADKKAVYLMKVDGTALKPGQGVVWDGVSNRWQQGSSAQIEPGDAVIVPDELSKWAFLRGVKDITTILYQIAVGARVFFK